MPEPAFTPARRGDLAVIVTEHHDTEIRDGHYTRVHSTQAELVIVTNITRDGSVKAFRRAGSDPDTKPVPLAWLTGVTTLALIPKGVIDVTGAIETAREHRWPSGGEYSAFMPFASLHEAREALRPHVY